MADIVITEFMAEPSVVALSADFDVRYAPELVDDRPTLLTAVGDARAVVVRNRTLVDDELLAAAPRLQVVARLGVGLDNIDLDACAAAGVKVRPATGANADAVAEYVVAAVMLLSRGVFSSSPRLLGGEWPREELTGREVGGRRLGLVGFGDIARRVAVRMQGLGMEVAAHDPHLAADDPAWAGARRLELDELLATCQATSVHVPLTSETRHLIDATALASMPVGAVLVNTSRGGVVDEHAVAAALRRGHLGGAALDVFEDEPLDEAGGRRFVDVPNLILTPHVAGLTVESNDRVSSMTADHVRRELAGD